MTKTAVFSLAIVAVGAVPAAAQQGGPSRAPIVSSATGAPPVELTLDEAVRRAVEHNPDLAIVKLGVDRSASRVAGARSVFGPIFSSAIGRF